MARCACRIRSPPISPILLLCGERHPNRSRNGPFGAFTVRLASLQCAYEIIRISDHYKGDPRPACRSMRSADVTGIALLFELAARGDGPDNFDPAAAHPDNLVMQVDRGVSVTDLQFHAAAHPHGIIRSG